MRGYQMIFVRKFAAKMCRLSTAVALLVLGSIAVPAQAQDWWGKALDSYFFDSRVCAFFSLTGVAEADPTVPDSPYFALSKTNPKYGEMNAVMLSAKAGSRRANVKTNDTSACGQAEVIFVGLE